MQVSVWILAALGVVILVNTLFVVGLAIALFQVQAKLDELLTRSGPLLEQASGSLKKLDDATEKIGGRLEGILDTSDRVVRTVGERIDTASAAAEEVVTEPLIQAAGVMAGLRTGLKTYARGASGPASRREGKEEGNGTDP